MSSVLYPEENTVESLTMGRIRELAADPELPGAYGEWAQTLASFLLDVSETPPEGDAISYLQRYAWFSPEAYDTSWLNYSYAAARAGACGQVLCFLFAEELNQVFWAQQKDAAAEALAETFRELFLLVAGSLQAELRDQMEDALLAQSLQETVQSMYWDFLEITEEMRPEGLSMYRESVSGAEREVHPHFYTDHLEDRALYLDRAWMERRLELAEHRTGQTEHRTDQTDGRSGRKGYDLRGAAADASEEDNRDEFLADPLRPRYTKKQHHLLHQMEKRLKIRKIHT